MKALARNEKAKEEALASNK